MSQLIQLTSEIMDLKAEGCKTFWQMGWRLNKIKQEKLYLEKYHFMEEYLEKEVYLERSTAYLYMKIAREIEVQSVGLLSSKRWQMLLPLKEEAREKVLDKVKNQPNISDQEFTNEVEQAKPSSLPQEDIPNEKYKEYWSLKTLGEKILVSLTDLKANLQDFSIIYEQMSKEKEWLDQPFKQPLINLRHQIIKEVDSLSVT